MTLMSYSYQQSGNPEKKKLNKETLDLNVNINQWTEHIFYQNINKCAFFSEAHGIFPKTDHILSHKKISKT